MRLTFIIDRNNYVIGASCLFNVCRCLNKHFAVQTQVGMKVETAQMGTPRLTADSKKWRIGFLMRMQSEIAPLICRGALGLMRMLN